MKKIVLLLCGALLVSKHTQKHSQRHADRCLSVFFGGFSPLRNHKHHHEGTGKEFLKHISHYNVNRRLPSPSQHD